MEIPPHASRPRIRPRDVVAYAEYHAGFSQKLTRWKLAVATDGRLVQHVHQLLPHLPEPESERHFEVTIKRAALDAILEEAAAVRFDELAEKYASSADDQEHMLLRVLEKEVVTYGAGSIVMYDEVPLVEVKRFLRVWNAVHRYAPFIDEHPPIPAAAPER